MCWISLKREPCDSSVCVGGVVSSCGVLDLVAVGALHQQRLCVITSCFLGLTQVGAQHQ